MKAVQLIELLKSKIFPLLFDIYFDCGETQFRESFTVLNHDEWLEKIVVLMACLVLLSLV